MNKPLSNDDYDGIAERKKSERLFQKTLARIWGPCLKFSALLMLVAPFLDDTHRVAMNFSAHVDQVAERSLWWLAAVSPELPGVVATVALCLGMLAQSLGSICILSLCSPAAATRALIGWTVLQPVLYAQLSNTPFVAGSLSLAGGLLMLRAHPVFEQEDAACARTRLVAARLLVLAVSVCSAWTFLVSAITLNETNDLGEYFCSLSVFVANTAAFLFLATCITLVALGIKTRHAALFLAVVNFGCVFFQHQFFLYAWIGHDGEWKYNERGMYSHIGISIFDIDLDDLSGLYDLHRYYFFLGLSSSGALLLLAQFGPGGKAVQKTEMCKNTATSSGLEQG